MEQPEGRILGRNFVLLSLATLAYFFGHFFFFPTLPLFIQDIGGSQAEVGFILGIAYASALALRPLCGRAVDTWGRRPVAALGMLIFVSMALAFSFAPSVPGLVPLRLLSGAAMSLFITASSAFIADLAPYQRRGEAISYYGVFSSVAMAVGPPLGFWIVVTPWLKGPEAALAGLPFLAPRWQEGHNFGVMFLAAALLGTLALLLTLGWREQRQASAQASGPRPPGSVWGAFFEPRAIFPSLIHGFAAVPMIAVLAFVPVLMGERELGNAGLFFTVYAGTIIATRLAVGHWSDRWGRTPTVVAGLGVSAGGLALLAVATPAWQVYGAAAIFGLGNGLYQPALQAFTIDRAAPERRGAAMATFSLGMDLGLVLGGFVTGLLVEAGGFPALYAMTAAVTVLGMMTFWIGVSGARWRAALRARAQPPGRATNRR